MAACRPLASSAVASTTQTSDFFRSRIAAMIDLRDPLAVQATRLPWDPIKAALAPMFAHKD